MEYHTSYNKNSAKFVFTMLKTYKNLSESADAH